MSINYKDIIEDKDNADCARLYCTDIGNYKLKITLVNRWAYFCANHKKELEECGLVASSDIALKTLEVSPY